MASINRIRVGWSGWGGGPGVSTFYFTGTDYAAVAPIGQFFSAIQNQFPPGITWTVPGSGDILDDATGALVGQWQHGSDTTLHGNGSAQYAAPVGVQVRWNTSQIHRGRRLVGRTFMVPISSNQYTSGGVLDSGVQAAMTTAANNLISAASNELVVWGRPKNKVGGLAGQMTTAAVPAKTVVLTSRRD